MDPSLLPALKKHSALAVDSIAFVFFNVLYVWELARSKFSPRDLHLKQGKFVESPFLIESRSSVSGTSAT